MLGHSASRSSPWWQSSASRPGQSRPCWHVRRQGSSFISAGRSYETRADARSGIEFSDGDRRRSAPRSRRLWQPADRDGAFQSGRTSNSQLETCGDADDVFVDPRRRRVYVSCGEGVVDVLEQSDTGYRHVARVPTVSGARTSLYVPEIDRLFVAVRARSIEAAAIWVFRPAP